MLAIWAILTKIVIKNLGGDGKMCIETEDTENSLNDGNEVGGMTHFVKKGRTYYTTRREAEAVRRKGDRIYYSERENAYYIRRVKKPFWGW